MKKVKGRCTFPDLFFNKDKKPAIAGFLLFKLPVNRSVPV